MHRRAVFRYDFQVAIGSYGEAAVTRAASFLVASDAPLEAQIAALRVLGRTGSRSAGDLILKWLGTLKPDRSSEHYWRTSEAFLALAALRELRALHLLSQLLLVGYSDLAIEALARFDCPESAEMLRDFMNSTAGTVYDRSRAASALARIDPSHQSDCERIRHDVTRHRLRWKTNRFWPETGTKMWGIRFPH